MSASAKIKAVYVEQGLDAIVADGELEAELATEPALRALLDRAENIDADLKRLPDVLMPEELAARIRRRARRRRRRLFDLPLIEHRLDFALVAGMALLALLPPAAGVWLLDQQRAEFSVLELKPNIVRLYTPEAAEPAASARAGVLVDANVAPTASVRVDGGVRKKLAPLVQALLAHRLPEPRVVAIDALVNAVPFPSKGESALDLAAECGPAPWGGETRLLRVQVDAHGTALEDVHFDVAFNLDRVAAYRLLAAANGQGAEAGHLAAHESFVALFEIVPKMAIADGASEAATVRAVAHVARESVRAETTVHEARQRFSAMPAAYRFAAAAAWFGLELDGERGKRPDKRALESILTVAARALEPKPEARTFLALVSGALAAAPY